MSLFPKFDFEVFEKKYGISLTSSASILGIATQKYPEPNIRVTDISIEDVTPSLLDCYINDNSLKTLENKAYKPFVTPVTLITPKNDNIQDHIIKQLEERVAIIEHDGQIPYDWALPIAKIQLRAKPESITKEKWQIIIQNLEMLIYYLQDIILHQWTIYDIFGCHPIVPETRFDFMGLLMLLNEGDRIIEINEDAIRIQGIRGSITAYYRPYYRYLNNRKACLDEI